MVRALERAGFEFVRQSGSHETLRNPMTRRKVSVPRHSKDIRRGLVVALIRQAGLTREEFMDLL